MSSSLHDDPSRAAQLRPERDGDPRGRPSAHDTGTAVGSADSARELGRLARDLQQELNPENTLQHVVEQALHLVHGARHASVSLVQRRRTITSAAATDDVARGFDALQQEIAQGPCLDTMYDHVTVRVPDFSAEQRWPVLARRWSDVGVRSALCLQLFVHGQDLGALNLLSPEVDAFDDESEHEGLLLAAHAAVALAASAKIEGLDRAKVNRTVIGQAEGILIERFKVSSEVAFALLSRVSQDSNRKLFVIAEELVRTGELSTPGKPR